MKITQELFGTLPDGRTVHKFIIPSATGLEVHILTWGGIITSIITPDRTGSPVDITLGFENLEDYMKPHPYIGAMIGRYANRISGAAFTLHKKKYSLTANQKKNHLHGGAEGFDKVLWQGSSFESSKRRGVILRHTSPGGHEGYPGTLQAAITCVVTDEGELQLQYHAESDEATPVNLTSHSYFNFTGGSKDILAHELSIDGESITEVDDNLIPTGKILSVENTPFDFRKLKKIAPGISEVPGGYDHNYCLRGEEGTLRHAATVHEPEGGIRMEVATTKPGLQFYTGNFLDGSLTGKGGQVYQKHGGFCLETQFWPDSPNQPGFPDCILRPGEEYMHTTVYKFSAE